MVFHRWYYLISLTAFRRQPTKLKDGESCAPTSNPSNFGVEEERKRSLENDDGINARDLVKLFRVTPKKGSDSRIPYLKEAVKGVSFGIKHNEILAIVGPNGAGE
jgi:ABC-type glutathione transport system ATPase component